MLEIIREIRRSLNNLDSAVCKLCLETERDRFRRWKARELYERDNRSFELSRYRDDGNELCDDNA